MLSALRLFKNVGQFDNATGQIALAPLTLLYAENGRGKTTLAAILRSLATGEALHINERRRLSAVNPPHVIIECAGHTSPAIFNNGAWTRTMPDMVVFDDQFVHDNVCSGLTVGSDQRQKLHELILGAQGVTLHNEVQRHIADVETHHKTMKEKERAIPQVVRGSLTVDEYCALPINPNIDIEIQDAERTLAAAKEQGKIAAGSEFQPVPFPEIDINEISALLARHLPDLEASATQRVQSHLTSLGKNGEQWVSYGMHKVQEQEGLIEHPACPFCEQNLDSSPIIGHYKAYFGEAYNQLKQDIQNSAVEFRETYSHTQTAQFERAVGRAQEASRFWGQFAEMPNLNLATEAIADKWTKMYAAVDAALRSKESNPLEAQTLSASAMTAVQQYQDARTSVQYMNEDLTRANATIALVKERAAAGDVRSLETDVAKLKATKSRHDTTMSRFCQEYLDAKNAKATSEVARDTAREALDQYRTNIFPQYETAINEYLRRLGASFRVTSVESSNNRAGSSCNYSVVIDSQIVPVTAATHAPGEPSFRTTLSAGDRNTLALAFFFASLDQTQGLASKVVVIDDPISSLDDHRSMATVQELRRLQPRVAQIVVLSHSKYFLCEVWKGISQTTKAAVQFVRATTGSAIQSWNVSADMVTQHDRHHELLRTYVVSQTPNNREVAVAIRPVLEAFLRVSFPENYTPGMMLGEFMNNIRPLIGTAREVLDQTSFGELNDLKDYGNLFHHDTNPSGYLTHVINDGQLLLYVQRALEFAKK